MGLCVRRRTLAPSCRIRSDLIKSFVVQSAVAIENGRYSNCGSPRRICGRRRIAESDESSFARPSTAGMAHEIKSLNFVNNFWPSGPCTD